MVSGARKRYRKSFFGREAQRRYREKRMAKIKLVKETMMAEVNDIDIKRFICECRAPLEKEWGSVKFWAVARCYQQNGERVVAVMHKYHLYDEEEAKVNGTD